MPDFGFSIKKTRSESIDTNSRLKYEELTRRVPSFKRCFQCGCCTATCSARQFSDFNIRRVHTMFRRGDTEGLSNQLKQCMLCGKCTLVCPRGVNIRQLVMSMRTILENDEKNR